MFFLVLLKFFISVGIVQWIFTKIHSNENKYFKSSVVDDTCLSESHHHHHHQYHHYQGSENAAQEMAERMSEPEIRRCAVKCCPLGIKQLLHTETHINCGYLDQTCTRSNQIKIISWEGMDYHGSTISWGAFADL